MSKKSKKKHEPLESLSTKDLDCASGARENPLLWAIGGYFGGKLVDAYYDEWKSAARNSKPATSDDLKRLKGISTRDRADHRPTTPFRGPKF